MDRLLTRAFADRIRLARTSPSPRLDRARFRRLGAPGSDERRAVPQTLAGQAVERLLAWEVGLAFYLSGGHALPELQALAERDHQLQIVQAHREAAAVSSADYFFRVTGRMAMACLTAGPGVTDGLTALMTALTSGSALFLLAAETPVALRGRAPAQELATAAILRPFTKACEVLEPRRDSLGRRRNPDAAAAVDRLMTIALSGMPGPVALVIPSDVGGLPAPRPSARRRAPITPRPPEPIVAQIRGAARLLARAKRVVIVAGYGAVISRAARALLSLARRLGARVITSARAKGIVPASDPVHLGVLGFAGHREAREALARADLVLVVGTQLGELVTDAFTVSFGKSPLVQVDIQPRNVGLNYPVVQAVVGDARRALDLINSELARMGLPARRRPWLLPAAPTPVAPASSAVRVATDTDIVGIFPRRAIRIIQWVVPRRAYFSCDIGAAALCFVVNELRYERPYRHLSPLPFGAMGTSLDGLVGAALGARGPVVCLIGDSAFDDSGSDGEIVTLVQLGLPVVIVVLDDRGNGMVNDGLARIKEKLKTKFPPVMFEIGTDYAKIAVARSAEARVAKTEEELKSALSEGLAACRPFLIHVSIVADPNDPTPMGGRDEVLATFLAPPSYSEKRKRRR